MCAMRSADLERFKSDTKVVSDVSQTHLFFLLIWYLAVISRSGAHTGLFSLAGKVGMAAVLSRWIHSHCYTHTHQTQSRKLTDYCSDTPISKPEGKVSDSRQCVARWDVTGEAFGGNVHTTFLNLLLEKLPEIRSDTTHRVEECRSQRVTQSSRSWPRLLHSQTENSISQALEYDLKEFLHDSTMRNPRHRSGTRRSRKTPVEECQMLTDLHSAIRKIP